MSGTMSTTNSTTVSTTDSTTTGTMTGTDTSTGCSGNEECPDGMPFCVGMVCVTCDATDDPDASCADLDDTTPVCSGSECVQCSDANDGACEGTTPICDAGTNTCVGCSFHSDCPDSACKIDTGECFDPADVSTVDVRTTCRAPSRRRGRGRRGVRGRTDRPTSNDSLTIDGNKAIAILRDDGASWSFVNSMVGGNPDLDISGASTRVYLEDIEVRQGSDLGLSVDAATVYLDETRVVNNAGGGISLTGGGYLQARNCFVERNGDDVAATTGISSTGSSFDFALHELVADQGNTGASSSSVPRRGTQSVRNCILVDTRHPRTRVSCSTGQFDIQLHRTRRGSLEVATPSTTRSMPGGS